MKFINKGNVEEKMKKAEEDYLKIKKSSKKALDFLKTTNNNKSMHETLELISKHTVPLDFSDTLYDSELERNRIKKQKKNERLSKKKREG